MKRGRGLKDVAYRVATIVGAEDCLLVGAMAVSAHGYVRATDDVDLITRLPLAEARRRLVAAGIPAALRSGDVLEGDFPCITGVWGGVRYDVLPQLVPIEWERSSEVVLARGRTLRVVDLEALLHLKLRAQGPQDLLDAAMLILARPEQRESALERATAYRVRERLDALLTDPRILQSHAGLNVRGSRGPRGRPKARSRR